MHTYYIHIYMIMYSRSKQIAYFIGTCMIRLKYIFFKHVLTRQGRSDGAMVLGKLPVPGRPII